MWKELWEAFIYSICLGTLWAVVWNLHLSSDPCSSYCRHAVPGLVHCCPDVALLPSLLAWPQTSLITTDVPGNHCSAGCMRPSLPYLLCLSTVGSCPFLVRTLHLPALLWPLANHLSCRTGCHTCLQQSLHLPSFNYLVWSGNLWLMSRRTSNLFS